MLELPHGTVAFLFTDVAGSTRLWQHHWCAYRPGEAVHDDAENLAAAIERRLRQGIRRSPRGRRAS